MSVPMEPQPHSPDEVRKLHRQAIDARTEGRFADQEEALKEAVELVGPLGASLTLWVKERYWLADAQRLQGRYEDAISVYDWLIGLTPNYENQKLTDKSSLHYLTTAFIYFVECVRHLRKLSAEDIHRKIPKDDLRKKITVDDPQDKIKEGLEWVKTHIKRPEWAAGLYLQWGLILKGQNRLEDAREKLHVALDFARECADAPGYTFATYLLELADLFCEIDSQVNAIPLAEEVLARADSNVADRQRAYKIRIYAQLEKEDMAAIHASTLKDQPLDVAVKSTGSVDNKILGLLQSINQKLVQVAIDIRQTIPVHSPAEERNTAQVVYSKKPESESVAQTTVLDYERIRNFSQLVFEQVRSLSGLAHEQAMDTIKLLQERGLLQGNQYATNLVPQYSTSPASLPEKERHITCLVALPSSTNTGELYKFHEILLPALRQALELEPYCWEVACEDQQFIESFEQKNVLAWLQRADIYIADISSGDFKLMIELGAMLSARKPDQPLLILKEEKCTPDFSGILGIIGGVLLIEYPSLKGSSPDDIPRVADKLKTQFGKHSDIDVLNKRKKAHYLSPVYLMKQMGGEAAQKLSENFKTMEAVETATAEYFKEMATAAGIHPAMITGVKEMIAGQLQDYRGRQI